MSMVVLQRLHRIALLILVSAALVGTGFAHHVSPVEDQRLAFVLATGASAADICDDGTPGSDHAAAQCLACQIAGGAVLPPAAGEVVPLDKVLAAQSAVARARTLDPRRPDPSNPSRGPPVA